MEKVAEFCKLAKEHGVTVDDMIECINSIRGGYRMTQAELKACEFLGEENTFWNPTKHLDYNWFIGHLDEIREIMN